MRLHFSGDQILSTPGSRVRTPWRLQAFWRSTPRRGPRRCSERSMTFIMSCHIRVLLFLDDKLLGKLLHLNSPERKGLALNFKQKVRTSFPSWEVQTLPYYFCTPITKHQTGRTVRLVFPFFFSNITIVHYSVYI